MIPARSLLMAALVGCLGGGDTVYDACDCTFDLPSGWSTGYAETGWLVESWTSDQSVRVEFIERTSQSAPYSAPVMLDAWIRDDATLDTSIAPSETIDGREASVREVGDYWTAMVPYDDGWVYLEAWSEKGADDWATPQAVIRSLARSDVPFTLTDGAERPSLRDEPVLERQVRTDRDGRADPETHEVPGGWVLSDYEADLGRMRAWVTPVRGKLKRPGVVYLANGWPTPDTLERLDPFVDLNLRVMAPSFRGDPGNPGVFDINGGELAELMAAIERFRSRADVDPEQIYLVGEGLNSSLALFGAIADPSLAATIVMGGSLEFEGFRARDPERVSRMLPVDDDVEEQTAVRSPAPFLGQLASPVWAFHGEFTASSRDGQVAAAIAHDLGVPLHWFLVPRGGAETWPDYLMSALARRISSPDIEDDEVQPLSFDDAFVMQLGRRTWEARWSRMAPQVEETARLLAGTRLLRPARVIGVMVEENPLPIDHRPVRSATQAVLEQWEEPPPSAESQAFRAALSQLSNAGLMVRPARPSDDPEAPIASALSDTPHRGFVYARADDLVRSLRYQRDLPLYVGDALPRTEAGTQAVRNEVAAALDAQGLAHAPDREDPNRLWVRVAWQSQGNIPD